MKFEFFRWLFIKAAVLLLLVMPSIAFGQVQVVSYQINDKNAEKSVMLDISGVTSYKVFQLSNPERLVVDLMNVRRGAFPLGKTIGGAVVVKIRSGIQNGVNLRVVLDLSTPVTVKSSNLKASGSGSKFYKLTVNFATKGTPQASAKPETVAPAISSFQPVPAAKPEEIKVQTIYQDTPKMGAKGGKPVIIIDAGHGGVDPGTKGYAGTFEKYVTLSYARMLKEKLEKTGRYNVMLTRSDDTYVDLKERVHKAKKVKGDLFLSLHADSHPDKHLRGLSVYTLSETASDKEAEELAAKENKSDLLYDVNLDTQNPEIAGILIDIIQRENDNASAIMAENIIRELDNEVKLLKYPHRFAGFRVLTAPDIPSLLIELGYLSNPEEEGLLNSPQYKKKVVNGIVRSIDSYFKDRRNL